MHVIRAAGTRAASALVVEQVVVAAVPHHVGAFVFAVRAATGHVFEGSVEALAGGGVNLGHPDAGEVGAVRHPIAAVGIGKHVWVDAAVGRVVVGIHHHTLVGPGGKVGAGGNANSAGPPAHRARVVHIVAPVHKNAFGGPKIAAKAAHVRANPTRPGTGGKHRSRRGPDDEVDGSQVINLVARGPDVVQPIELDDSRRVVHARCALQRPHWPQRAQHQRQSQQPPGPEICTSDPARPFGYRERSRRPHYRSKRITHKINC